MTALGHTLSHSMSASELVGVLRVDDARPRTPLPDDELRSQSARTPRWPLVALAAAAGVVASLLIVPRGGELDAVRARTPARAQLEAAIASGDPSAGTVIALARERQRAGDSRAGLVMLQQLAEREPLNAQAWQAWGDMLHDAGRAADSVAALERAQRLAPTPERDRLIAARRPPPPDASSVRQVRGTVGVENQDLVQRAERLLLSGAPKEALAALDSHAAAQPRTVDAALVALQMKAVLADAASGRSTTADAAALRARSWLDAHPATTASETAQLASMLSQAGHHAHAAKLLEPRLEQGEAPILGAWSAAMRETGQGDAAMARLARLRTSNDDVLRQRVRLAIDLGKPEAALDVLRAKGLERVPADVVGHVVIALTADASRWTARQPLLRELWTRTRPTLTRQDPLLAARLAAAVGDIPAATGLVDNAAASCGGGDCAVRLAVINHQLGRGPETLAALRQVEGDIDDALLADFARLSVIHGHAVEALARVERQRRPVATPTFQTAWALAATAAGRQSDVLRWLETTRAGDIPETLVRELFDAATRTKANPLTIAAGSRLEPRNVKPSDRVLLAQALMDSGRSADAFAQWRQVRATSNAYDDAYASALRAALARGEGADTAKAFVQAQLAALGGTPAGPKREALVRQLLDLGGHAEVLPVLETLAQAEPSRWLLAFEDAARKANQPDRVQAVWRKVVNQASLPAERRLQIAVALADAGDRKGAEPALRSLGTDAAPGDAVVERLLAWWGAKPSAEQLDWIDARAQAVGTRGEPAHVATQRRAAWMQHLNNRGGAARSVALFQRLPSRPNDGPVHAAYLDALARLGDQAGVAAALDEARLAKP